MAGAPKGNQNAAKAKLWTAAINRALDKRTRREGVEAIDALAEKLLTLCDEDNLMALKELGDRLEGKPSQVIAGDSENPLEMIQRVERTIVDPEKKGS